MCGDHWESLGKKEHRNRARIVPEGLGEIDNKSDRREALIISERTAEVSVQAKNAEADGEAREQIGADTRQCL